MEMRQVPHMGRSMDGSNQYILSLLVQRMNRRESA